MQNPQCRSVIHLRCESPLQISLPYKPALQSTNLRSIRQIAVGRHLHRIPFTRRACRNLRLLSEGRVLLELHAHLRVAIFWRLFFEGAIVLDQVPVFYVHPADFDCPVFLALFVRLAVFDYPASVGFRWRFVFGGVFLQLRVGVGSSRRCCSCSW